MPRPFAFTFEEDANAPITCFPESEGFEVHVWGGGKIVYVPVFMEGSTRDVKNKVDEYHRVFEEETAKCIEESTEGG